MKPIQAMIKLHYINIRKSFLIFWLIYISIFAISALLLNRYGDNTTNIGGGTLSIFIYVFVCGIVSLKDAFPYTLGMNLRRKDYVIANVLAFGALTVCMEAINLFMSFIEEWIVNHSDVEVAFFSLGSSLHTELSRMDELMINLSGMFHFLALGLLIATASSRLKKNGMFILGGAVFLLVTLAPDAMWTKIGKAIVELSSSVGEFAFWLTLLSAFWFVISYLLIRRMTVAD